MFFNRSFFKFLFGFLFIIAAGIFFLNLSNQYAEQFAENESKKIVAGSSQSN